ncbi:hypothetical protein BU17DRAFT_72122 [Hysterangium stoloniferum]|nr:hypothetical protein BU17DRAFT_72122 [Hysterangium stoloniferum]
MPDTVASFIMMLLLLKSMWTKTGTRMVWSSRGIALIAKWVMMKTWDTVTVITWAHGSIGNKVMMCGKIDPMMGRLPGVRVLIEPIARRRTLKIPTNEVARYFTKVICQWRSQLDDMGSALKFHGLLITRGGPVLISNSYTLGSVGCRWCHRLQYIEGKLQWGTAKNSEMEGTNSEEYIQYFKQYILIDPYQKPPFCIPQSKAPSTYNPTRSGYKQEDIDMQPLNERVYNLFGREVVHAMLLGWGFNFKADAISSSRAVEKISREVAVLKLLHRVSPQVPASRVLACDFYFNNTVGAPFMIMNRLYGENQWMAWPKLSGDDKLPSIGSIETLTPGGLPIIGSILPIRTLAISAIPRDDHTMFVPVLVHMDLRSKNIMVKDATVSGIVDWEIHSSLPACLEATYPEFIHYDAAYNPKYGIQPRLMPTKECWPLEDHTATLRNVFRETHEFFPLSRPIITYLDFKHGWHMTSLVR